MAFLLFANLKSVNFWVFEKKLWKIMVLRDVAKVRVFYFFLHCVSYKRRRTKHGSTAAKNRRKIVQSNKLQTNYRRSSPFLEINTDFSLLFG
jgi:hypothetical protein